MASQEGIDYIPVTMEGGKISLAHAAKFEEASQAMALVQTVCKEMEGAVYDFIPETAKALLPIFSVGDECSMLSDNARGTAWETWALLAKSARAGGAEKGVSNPLEVCEQLLATAVQKTFAMMEVEVTDMETLTSYAHGLRGCIKNAEGRCLTRAKSRSSRAKSVRRSTAASRASRRRRRRRPRSPTLRYRPSLMRRATTWARASWRRPT